MKKRIMLLIILLSIFMIGAVSASATNTTDTVSTKLTNKEIVKKEDVVSKSKKDKLGISYTGNFDGLSKEINNTPTGGTLNLQKNYKYRQGSTDGIRISKSITINGNGHTINGNKQSRIFKVDEGIHLILKNLNIINGKSGDGGAIHIRGFEGNNIPIESKITITNCTFTNNNAYTGGAIHAYSYYNVKLKLTIKKSTFINNAVPDTGIGSAISVFKNSDLTITKSTFENNKAGYGTIHAGEECKVTITNSKFINNIANYDEVIDVDSSSKLTITNSKFNKDTSKIIAKAKTFKTKIKTKKYTITLKSGKKPIKQAKITLKINKKTYHAQTNTKGKATFKITKLNKKGKYTATINYPGDKNYKKSTKKVKITLK